MADIRDFFSYKKNKEAGQEEADRPKEPAYEEKIKSHKKTVMIRTIIILVLAALAVVFIYFRWRNRTYSEARVAETVSITDMDGTSYQKLGNVILTYSKDGASCLTTTGETVWNETFEMQDPFVRTCSTTAAIGDYNGRTIYVADTKGPLGQVNTNLPIRDFCVSSQGVVAAVLDDKDVAWIYLYDSEGKELASFRTSMQNSGYPFAISLSPNGELLGVSFLRTQNGQMLSSVAFYNFGDVGQNKVDNYASGFDYPDTVAPMVQFMNENTAFAVANDRIMFYTGSEVPQSKAENLIGEEEIRSVYYNEQYVGLVFSNGTDEGTYRLQVYNSSGSLVLTKYFSLEYTDILFANDQIIISNDTEWQICSMRGKDRYHGVFDENIRALLPSATKNHFFAVLPGTLETLELR